MPMLRWILGGVACLVAGGIFLGRYYMGVPALEQLTTVTGDVSSAEVEIRRSRRSQTQYLAVRIADKPPAFYVERFPDFDRVVETIKPADRVTAWVDAGKDNYIWQLDKGSERLVSYEQVAEAQRTNLRNNALFGILFVVFGVGTLVVMMWRWRTGAS